MDRRVLFALLTATALSTGGRARAEEAASVDAAMLRTPDVSANQVVFVYDRDIWIAPKTGGTALPLSGPAGMEQFPRFSPDGTKVAFAASYDGNGDIYELPVGGGVPKRMTFQPGGAFMVDYAPDGRIVFGSGHSLGRGTDELFYASPSAGLPEALPAFQAMFASFSADGQWAAIDPSWIEYQNWNRYQGGTAADVWLVNMQTLESRKLTDWAGTDTLPMFSGNDRVYYLSDAGPEHRRNIWLANLADGSKRQLTEFRDFETKWPSIGPNDIVMENGGQLWLLDLATEKVSAIRITLPGDRIRVMKQTVDVTPNIYEASISPQGKRVALNARGDIWTVPAEKGYARNLTRTDNVFERDPVWSADSKQLAYFSDRTGEYELYVRPADGSGEEKQLTSNGTCFRYAPRFSPDGKKLSFSDKTGTGYVFFIDSGETVTVDKDPWGGQGLVLNWARDSNWLTYPCGDARSTNTYIKLYNLKERKAYNLTSPAYNSYEPVFDMSGDFIFFRSNREYFPAYPETQDWGEFSFFNTTGLFAVPLRKDVASPFLPKNDEDAIKPDDAAAGDAKPADAAGDKPADAPADGAAGAAEPKAGEDAAKPADADKKAEEAKEPEPLKIDTDGIEARTLQLPLPSGNYGNLQAGDKKLFYVRYPATGSVDQPLLAQFEFGDDPKETPLVPGAYGFELSGDGSKMLVAAQGAYFIAMAAPGAALDKPLNYGGLSAEIDPRAEWRELVTDAWRRYRDYFYDPKMHGVDWDAQLKRALKLVDFATNRGDVDYIVRQMVAELNSGHTYVVADAGDPGKFTPIGLLGCDFDYSQDADGKAGVRISRIYNGADWDADIRSPLSAPGVDVAEGDFLLAVNDVPLSADGNPYALLNGSAGKTVSLTVSKKAVKDGTEKCVLVAPLGDENELRLRAWIEANRRYVFEQTGGKIGYIYVRDTSEGGHSDFMRQFNGQRFMQGLIIDERWNGGGLSPDLMIQILSRKIRNYWGTRDSLSWMTPGNVAPGPKVMLINENAGSGGDSFPWLFRQYGIGKIVGKRTWGGLIGISGNPGLIDGSEVTVPSFGIYEPNGTWAVEGHGVDPDVDVANDPTTLAQGKDAQLDAGIKTVLEELAAQPWDFTPKPAYPDRSGAGVLPEDM